MSMRTEVGARLVELGYHVSESACNLTVFSHGDFIAHLTKVDKECDWSWGWLTVTLENVDKAFKGL